MTRLSPLFLLGLGLVAQTPAPTPGPSLPPLTWRGSVWALGAISDRETSPTGDLPGGQPFLRPMDARNGGLVLDGFQFGVDADLGHGFAFKLTFMGGRSGQLTQEFAGESGTLAIPEAMLIWTKGADTLRFGRMWTFMGMESSDLTAAIPASHGLMATFPLPYGQVGLHWRHVYNPQWSTDLWVVDGEDRNTDNNRGKTVGGNLTWNVGGAADKFLNLTLFTGPEQDAVGHNAIPGAEGRRRDRLSHGGQWVWGGTTLVWEGEYLRERLASSQIQGATGSTVDGTYKAAALWLKQQVTPVWSGYLRLEQAQDDLGFKLNWDTSVAAAHGLRLGADLTARSASLGVERKVGPAFWRAEVRHDRLNKDVRDADGKTFRGATSATVAVGASFTR